MQSKVSFKQKYSIERMIDIESKIQCQCFICKQTILTDRKKKNDLDPCAVTIFTNADEDIKDQKSQTFFCHYDCFRRVNNDDSVLYLDSLQTHKEIEEENQTIHDSIEELAQFLYQKGDEYGVWLELVKNESGKWIALRDIVGKNSELIAKLDKVENLVCEPLLICWVDDNSSEKRVHKYSWKVVIIATESHYEFPVTLLIHVDKNYIG